MKNFVQYFGGQTRCIMRDVQMVDAQKSQLLSSKAILGFLNWSLCYGYSWKFYEIFLTVGILLGV